jgi:TolB-like protein
MKKRIIVLALLCAAMTAFGQSKPALGILPFSGGRGNEGDTIAGLFANSPDLDKAFDTYLRTSGAQAIDREHDIQRTGLTDSDNIAQMGRLMNVDYVVSGHITRLGNVNLLLISIIDVETMEQIAGDYRTYNAIGNVRAMLPDMAAKIIASVRQKPSGNRISLAVLPLDIQDQRINRDDAEVLSNILATEIANTHKYIVLPRTSTIEAALTEQSVQQNSGYTSRENLAAIGKATNARYVLSGIITYLGGMNLFIVNILDIESGKQVPGGKDDAEYRNLEDGVEIMRDMARNITGVTKEEATSQLNAELLAKATLNSIGVTAGSTFTVPWFLLNVGGTASFWPYTFFDAGLDLGFIHGYEGRDDIKYFSLYPYAHFNGYLPVGDIIRGIVGDAIGDIVSLYIGAGAGCMVAFYETADEKNTLTIPALDITTGVYLGQKSHYLKIAYSLRVPFTFNAVNHRIVLGYSYRF